MPRVVRVPADDAEEPIVLDLEEGWVLSVQVSDPPGGPLVGRVVPEGVRGWVSLGDFFIYFLGVKEEGPPDDPDRAGALEVVGKPSADQLADPRAVAALRRRVVMLSEIPVITRRRSRAARARRAAPAVARRPPAPSRPRRAKARSRARRRTRRTGLSGSAAEVPGASSGRLPEGARKFQGQAGEIQARKSQR